MTIALQPLYSLLRRLTGNAADARNARLARARFAGAVSELSVWSDRELADIGLNRAQIQHAVYHGRERSERDRCVESSRA